MEIKGEVTTAVCYAKVVDEKAIEQIKRMCDYEFTRDCKVRIMPDVHAGKGCTIGTTMSIIDKVVPNIVGVDIGCGMYTINIGKEPIDFEKLDKAAHFVPSGMNVWEEVQEEFDFTELSCCEALKNMKWLTRSYGTLGGGNHFIEVDQSKDGTNYLVIHTGSRNLGKQVAEFYQQLAIDLNKGKEDYPKQRENIIKEYHENGREKEIQAALKAISWSERTTNTPEDLCHLYGSYFQDYLHDVEVCQKFARKNREYIAKVLLNETGMKGIDGFHTIHNYIDTSEMILRKGAIAAHKGEKILIPINMRDGSVLAIGKGNPEWNYSAPHGAGRIMSRMTARKNINIDEYRQAMEGIYTTSVNLETLDEAPMAYKSLEDIIDVIKDSVEIVDIMKPIYNFKASE